jgi:hypothetical protein
LLYIISIEFHHVFICSFDVNDIDISDRNVLCGLKRNVLNVLCQRYEIKSGGRSNDIIDMLTAKSVSMASQNLGTSTSSSQLLPVPSSAPAPVAIPPSIPPIPVSVPCLPFYPNQTQAYLTTPTQHYTHYPPYSYYYMPYSQFSGPSGPRT